MEMRGRVMILDYVLAHPGEWLSTETERKSWFRDVAGISTSEMPSRVYPGRNGQFTRRYFIDKTPVSVSKEAPVRLVFVDPSYHSEEPFTSFLDLYHGLFAGLEQAEICYVSAHRWRFEKCAGTVQRTFCSDPNPALDRDRLLGYFEMESRYRDSNWKTFDFPEMQRLKADRDHFATADTSHFFDAWNRGGTAELARILVSENATETGSRVAFSTHLLTGNYDIFGRVTDVRGVTIPANSIVCGGPRFLDKKSGFLRWRAALKMKESQCPERAKIIRPA
jgi:hypothetical protein